MEVARSSLRPRAEGIRPFLRDGAESRKRRTLPAVPSRGPAAQSARDRTKSIDDLRKMFDPIIETGNRAISTSSILKNSNKSVRPITPRRSRSTVSAFKPEHQSKRPNNRKRVIEPIRKVTTSIEKMRNISFEKSLDVFYHVLRSFEKGNAKG